MNKESIDEIIEEILKIDKKTIKLVEEKNKEIETIKDKYETLIKEKKQKYKKDLEQKKNDLKEKILKEGNSESERILNQCQSKQEKLEILYNKEKESLLQEVFKKIFN